MKKDSMSYQGREPLSDAILRQYAPSIFASEAHESRSGRYTYIPTIEVLNGLRKEGFQPFFVAQSRTRVPGKQEFTKHMLRLRHASSIDASEAQEIIVINSHDGTSGWKMINGVLRFVCMNGHVCGDQIESFSVHHKGDIIHDVVSHAYGALRNFDVVSNNIIEMKETRMIPEARQAFAESALALRWEPELIEGTDTLRNTAPITVGQVLRLRRQEDAGESVWNTLNVVQENLMRGGMAGTNSQGQRRATRPVQGVDQTVKINRMLWSFAARVEELLKAKAA